MQGTDLPTLITAVLAIVILVDISVLWLTGRQVPELLMQLVSAMFGYYFGRTPGQKRGGTR